MSQILQNCRLQLATPRHEEYNKKIYNRKGYPMRHR